MEHGGFFLSADDAERSSCDPRTPTTARCPRATPSRLVLAKLGRVTTDECYDQAARGVLRAFSRRLAEMPVAHTMMLAAVDFLALPSYEVVIAGDPGAQDTRALLRALGRRFLPSKVVLLRPPGDEPEIAALAPWTEDQLPQQGRATAYVCRNFACNLPTSDPEKMLALLTP